MRIETPQEQAFYDYVHQEALKFRNKIKGQYFKGELSEDYAPIIEKWMERWTHE